jgi:hypothetical protein
MTDFTVYNHGSVWQIEACSLQAKEFAERHFDIESWQGVPQCFVCDWRPAAELVERLREDGFVVIGQHG